MQRHGLNGNSTGKEYTSMNKDLTILMTSCDAYSDVLKIHDELFRRHWRNCPFDKILAIDKLNYDMQDYSLWNKIIEVGRNAEGVLNGQRVTEGLRHVTTPYVLLLQEDFLLYDNVDTELIRSVIDLAIKYDAGNIRFVIDPETENVYSKEDNLLEYKRGMAYRLSMQAGLWKTNYLYNIMSKYKNGSEFEREGSFESSRYKEPILAWGGGGVSIFKCNTKGEMVALLC